MRYPLLDRLCATSRTTLLVILALVTWACTGGGGGGGTINPPAGGTVLGDLASEIAYANSVGNGTIQIQIDPNLNNTGVAEIINGQRRIRLNPFISNQTPAAQAFFRLHEIGHHYCNHHSRFGLNGCQFAEYEADAFATRVLQSISGTGASQEVAAWFLGQGCPPDATHRSCAQRSQFISQVSALLLSNPETPPQIPAASCATGTTGVLLVANPLGIPLGLYANNVAINVIIGAQSQQALVFYPGGYQIIGQMLVFPFSYFNLGGGQVRVGEITTTF